MMTVAMALWIRHNTDEPPDFDIGRLAVSSEPGNGYVTQDLDPPVFAYRLPQRKRYAR